MICDHSINELTLQKKLQTIVTNNVFYDKKVKTQQQQNTKLNKKNLVRAGNQTWELSHPSRMRYLWTTESTECINCCKVFFNCFNAMGRNVNKLSRICGPHIFNKLFFL